MLDTQAYKGVTLAQLVKAFVGQADVQRFEPHLGHNWLSCGVFLAKSRHFGLPLALSCHVIDFFFIFIILDPMYV